MNIIGMENAGFVITEAIETNFKTAYRDYKAIGFECSGYCIGHNGFEYITWRFISIGTDVSFDHGHYIMDDRDAPARSKARARADLYARAAEAFAQQAEYGY